MSPRHASGIDPGDPQWRGIPVLSQAEPGVWPGGKEGRGGLLQGSEAVLLDPELARFWMALEDWRTDSG